MRGDRVSKVGVLRTVLYNMIGLMIIIGLVWPGEGLAQDKENDMILVEGGSYIMRPAFHDQPGPGNPNLKVTLNNFYIGKYEVTFEEYDLFCILTERNKPSDQGWGRGQRPVINISWQDAVDYCNWRSELEGVTPVYSGKGIKTECDFKTNGYRLPTEPEWTYAARGGQRSGDYKYSGSSDVDKVAWYEGNAGIMTHLVGEKQANEVGLYDMSGNVNEWCWDPSYWMNRYGPPEKSLRAYRGGSWRSDAPILAGDVTGLDMTCSYIGFRVVRTAPG
ncbi:MAG: Sulphatase-modifying factor protein [Firmicutes bacterium]|nr:Sulphatase-modifying factor protein [Bacillota bacterium]